MTGALIQYLAASSLLTAVLIFSLYRLRSDRAGGRFILFGLLDLICLSGLAITYPLDGFGRLQLLTWGVVLFFPLYLAASAVILQRTRPGWSAASGGLLAIILAIGIDALLIEPSRLQVTRLEIASGKLQEPVTIAVLADIQTDSPGRYEERVLRTAIAENPDLVLFAGDYLQVSDPVDYQQAAGELNGIFRSAALHPRLGSYAIRGNVDWNQWEEIFAGTDVVPISNTLSMDLGPIQLTGLGWQDSKDPSLVVGGAEKYHLVLGHYPNFGLGKIEADLLLAGHTHGGQFKVPFFGPVLTLSAVPRSWSSGLTELGSGSYLLVSRGIGVERGDAPRMRFLCRPEVVILHLLPAD